MRTLFPHKRYANNARLAIIVGSFVDERSVPFRTIQETSTNFPIYKIYIAL